MVDFSKLSGKLLVDPTLEGIELMHLGSNPPSLASNVSSVFVVCDSAAEVEAVRMQINNASREKGMIIATPDAEIPYTGKPAIKLKITAAKELGILEEGKTTVRIPDFGYRPAVDVAEAVAAKHKINVTVGKEKLEPKVRSGTANLNGVKVEERNGDVALGGDDRAVVRN